MLDLGLDLETMPTARSLTYAQAIDLPIEVVRNEASKKQQLGSAYATRSR